MTIIKFQCHSNPWLFAILLCLCRAVDTNAQILKWEGQLAGWASMNADRSKEPSVGLRYIPDLSIDFALLKKWTLAAEASVNAYSTVTMHASDHFTKDGRIRPYRFWLRLATNQLEIRCGLQKLSFGSAMLIRPLMWFDRMDARDPLQLTDGVYGILVRYTFLDNGNVWLWGLVGNDEIKGWEGIPSTKRDPEFGGRLQFPTPKGEVALSAHRRRMDLKRGLFGILPLGSGSPFEDRLAVDGKWDLGVGVWFEAASVHQRLIIPVASFQRFLNIGMDYTFGIGNGLHALSEYFQTVVSNEALGPGQNVSFSAVSLNYPLGLLDNLTGMLYYNWENRDWYRLINLQRKYDNWSFYLIGFWNPERFQIYQNLQETNPFAGRGIQLMIVWNY